MKALVSRRYGKPERLRLVEKDQPPMQSDVVLVRVHAASLNSWDWDILRGHPLFLRLESPFRPVCRVFGADYSGVVEAVGSGISDVQVGDEVYGDLSNRGFGAFAEWALANRDALHRKPSNLSFVEAAAVPQAAIMAWQGLVREADLQSGERVLINGACGGVGTFAIQIARYLGATVTAVDRGDKLPIARELGAAVVRDYREAHYSDLDAQFDVILDCALHTSASRAMKALSPSGRLIVVGGSSTGMLLTFLKSIGMGGKTPRAQLLVAAANEGLDDVTELIEQGHLRPVIESEWKLEQAAEAMARLAAGDVVGKTVLNLERD